ncbi:acyl-CoA dehydrogenase family protein [Granulicoccus phenolivorans]|uniref:acyl-CoA dehydrogenase family protein n=1 Tax=Granulicoccus phenolivorans TaxID=266854 RepID=UPI00138B08B0|nr:acyl-CoA dehydrogenase family protein [Granulicoccus phenolivorans]
MTTVLRPTLRFDDADEDVRARLRRFIDDHDPGRPSADFPERVAQLRQWQAALCAAGFIGMSWPESDGGQGRGLSAEAVLCEELGRTTMPELINRIALYTVAPMIQQWGTPEQRSRLLPGMLDASEIWCQGFSEPSAGSDLAGIRTRARRDGDDWVINGQKVWTSRALWSKWCALLVRTDGEPGSHKGLTLVALDMGTPGVTVRPLYQMLHEAHFSEVFFDDVRVPHANVIGEPGQGWRVAMSTMGFERGLFVLERQIGLRRRLAVLAEQVGERPDAHVKLGELAAMLEVLRAHTYRTLAEQDLGILEPGSTSVDKLLLTECYQAVCGEAFDLNSQPDRLFMDEIAHDLIEARSVSIYSGSTEIQRNVIGSQILGLPRRAK